MELKIQKPVMSALIWVTVLFFIASAFCGWLVDKHDFNPVLIDTLGVKLESVVFQLDKLSATEGGQTESQITRHRALCDQAKMITAQITELEAQHENHIRAKLQFNIFLCLALAGAGEIVLNLRGQRSVTLIVSKIISVICPYIRLITLRVPQRQF